MGVDFRPWSIRGWVAREALELGKHVFLYSDNVSLEDEIALKKTAREKGLLVMGPDCGTAIINGMAGFANRVRRTMVVGAGQGRKLLRLTSTTSAGHSMPSAQAGDLKSDVGAITAHQSLICSRDPETKVLCCLQAAFPKLLHN